MILASEPQADALPFQFQNERAVSHFHSAQEVHRNQTSSAFSCKLLVPKRKQHAVLFPITSLCSCLNPKSKGQHHKSLSVPTALPKTLQ